MRKFLIPILLIIIMAGCSKKPDATYIKGSIAGLGNDTIYLYNVDSRREMIDTIVVLNDKFEYPIEVDTASTNILQFSNGTEFPLFLEKNTSFSIQGDTANLDKLSIQGGEINSAYAQFLNKASIADSMGIAINKTADDYIRENQTSTISIYLLNKYFVQIDNPNYAQIKKMIESLSGTLQDDQRIIDLNEFLTQRDKVTVGKTTAFFTLQNPNKEKVTRNDNFKDQILVINFWASWSEDSLSTNHQQMRNLYKKFRKNKDVGVLGISFDINREDWVNAIKRDTLKWEQASDLSGLNSTVASNFAITELPTTILLGKNGRIVARDIPVDSISKLVDIEIKKEKAKEDAKTKKR